MLRLAISSFLAALLLPLAAAAQDARVVGWGDSITYGYYDFSNSSSPNHCYDGHPVNNPPENCGFVGRIDARLNAESPTWNIQVLNLGKGGEKTPEALTRMGDPAAACPGPNPNINKLKYWQCNAWIQAHDVLLVMEGSNDVTQQISRETIKTNLEQMGLKAEAYGFEVVLATLIHRHPFACIDAGNSKTQNVNSDIRGLTTSYGWGLVDTYARLDVLPALFNNYYQDWDPMKCDPNLPDPPPPLVDPLGHINNLGFDKVSYDAGSQQYPFTYEHNVKLVLPPRITLTAPAPIQTGVPATFSVALHDLATTARLLWDFGDGRFGLTVAPAASPATWNHVYLVPGSYSVTVTATHPNGSTRVRSTPINVTGADLTLFADGFESGDATAWSGITP